MLSGAILLTTAALVGLAIAVPAGAAEVGKAAPVFSAETSTGTISLADFRGKKNVLLAFYFKDFSAG